MLKNMVRRLAIVIMMGASTLVATQTSASAAAPWSWCPEGKLCFASGLNGEGTRWSYQLSEMAGGVQMSRKQRNQISSAWNRTGVGASVYDNPNCVSSSRESVPGVWVESWQDIWIDEQMNLNEWTYDRYFATYWDDRAQSFSTWGPEWPDGTRCAKRIP